ncbi:MAG: PQQ-binding-like beta-propeller repeat protein [Chloroflexi bacterium]|nr:PQQ-binding-like beta-propeller repeat protein [Chloroflexota bacterium]
MSDSSGAVNIGGGEIRARDIFSGDKIIHGDEVQTKIVVTAAQAYDVRGLANPYLGLARFTYADAKKYAGREKLIAETVARVTAPGAAIPLLFITGASGSGKSSFAQAGLVPALETHYHALRVKHAVFRPGADPLAALADALWRQLGVTETCEVSAMEFIAKTSQVLNTPASQINLILLDQFEECFTQSPAASRAALFEFLAHLAPFAQTRTHILATLRADYLPELFNHPALYEIAKRGVDLRAMSVTELRDAIQQPLRAQYPQGDKRFEPELVEQLAQDAAPDAAYLPLLQVTLAEIWRKGALTRGAYTNLADALEQRADQVLQFRDYDAANPAQPRTSDEQNALLTLLLDLVDVSLDDQARRDVRHQRAKQELAHGDATRTRWVDELAAARLLSIENQQRVDLIHESLLVNWERLRAAIGARRHALRERARFEQNLDEWLAQNRADDYLLEGVRLAEARELEKREDIALQRNDAKTFLRASITKAEAEQQRELERERQRTAAEERARRAAEQRARILRFAALALSALLLVAVAAVYLAVQQQNEAIKQARIAESRRLAAQSNLVLARNRETSLLLGVAAVQRDENFEARNTLFTALNTLLRTTLRGHTANVWSVTFSPDGKTLASASCAKNDAEGDCVQGEIRLWDASSGKQIGNPLMGHTGLVRSVAFSPDGKLLASGSFDRTIRLWDAANGKPLGQPLTGHTAAIDAVVFSPDGKLLASGGGDRTIRLWDVASGAQVGEPFAGHSESVIGVAFSPDSKTLASGSGDGTIRLWDVASGEQIGDPLAGKAGNVFSVAFSPDGKTLASGNGDGTIRLWNVTKSALLGNPLTGHTGLVYSVAFSPDGKTLASGSGDGTIRFWDLQRHTSRIVTFPPFADQTNGVFSVAFSPDGKTLASGNSDHTIRLWNVRDSREIGDPIAAHRGSVFTVAFSPNDALLASGGDDGTIRLWDAPRGKPMGEPLTGHEGIVRAVVFSPDGKLLASASDDRTIRLWSVPDGKPLDLKFIGHEGAVRGIAFSPDGTLLASASGDQRIRLWDVTSGKPIGEPFTGHSSLVYSVTFSPDGKTLASASDDKTIRLWNVASGKPIGEPLTGHTGAVYTVAFSPDGKTLVSGSGDQTLRLWDVPSRQPSSAPFTGHTSSVNSVEFGPDGKTLASGSSDGTIRLWDMTNGKQIGEPFIESAFHVYSVAFNHDGKLLVSGSADQTVRLWDVDPDLGLAAARACRIVNRNLSRVEWAQFFDRVSQTYDSVYAKNRTCPDLPVEPASLPTPAVTPTRQVSGYVWRMSG